MRIKTIFLLRGLPGAGKSTVAKALDVTQFESDKFFIDPKTGEYKFDGAKLKDAHEWCRKEVEIAMTKGISIAVSNTFTKEWEMIPYYELAKTYGYRVFSLIVENRHGGKNEHNVPDEVLKAMKDRFEVKL